MKKNFILIVLLLISPFNAYALTGSTSISCEKTTLNPGESTTCSLKGTVSGDTVSAVETKIKTDTNLTVESVTPSGDWQGDKNDVNIVYYTSDNKSNTFDIANVVIKASNTLTSGANASISLTETKFSSGSDYKETAINTSTKEIRIASTINTLSSLTISKGSLTPNFNSNNINYSASVEDEIITINATKTNDNSTVSGDIGTKNLKYGSNSFSIKVTSESGTAKVYNINVTRIDKRDKDNSLKTLTINDKEIELSDDKLEYTYDVENSTEQVIIEAELNSKKSSFIEKYEPRTVNLNEGENKVELKILAENETIKTYTLTINRAKAIVENNISNSTEKTTGISNPKTGSLSIYIIFLILIISFITMGIIFFHKKKEENKNEIK